MAAVLVVPAALLIGGGAAAQVLSGADDLPLDTRILTRGEARTPPPLPVPTSAGPASAPIPFLEPQVSGIPSLPGFADEAPDFRDADVVVKGKGFSDPDVKVASLPDMAPGDKVGLVSGNGFRIRFTPGAEELDTEAGDLIAGLSERLMADTSTKIEIRAYAGAKPDPASARRISLSRALNIRAFMVDRGIANTRIAVRALGNTSAPDQPADRVDLRIQ